MALPSPAFGFLVRANYAQLVAVILYIGIEITSTIAPSVSNQLYFQSLQLLIFVLLIVDFVMTIIFLSTILRSKRNEIQILVFAIFSMFTRLYILSPFIPKLIPLYTLFSLHQHGFYIVFGLSSFTFGINMVSVYRKLISSNTYQILSGRVQVLGYSHIVVAIIILAIPATISTTQVLFYIRYFSLLVKIVGLPILTILMLRE